MEPVRNYHANQMEMGHYQGMEVNSYNEAQVNAYNGMEAHPYQGNGSEDDSQKPVFHEVTNIYEEDPRSRLHRELKTRQISMIALGGALGTGLLINT